MEKGLLIPEQIQQALVTAKKTGQPLEETLVDLGFLTKEEVYSLIAKEAGVPYLDLANYLVDPKVVELIPKETTRKHLFFPVFRIGTALTVAISDPTNFLALDEIRRMTDCEVEICISSLTDIKAAINRSYGTSDAIDTFLKGIGEKGEVTGTVADITGEAPITRLVELIISQAVRDRASDIHVEPTEESLRIRFRVDGILYEIPALPKHLELAVISRLKIQASLDINTTRVPQDGHFKVMVEGREVDIRVSTVPTIYGENVVLRLLSAATNLFSLEQLGFEPDALQRFEEIISKPWGIVLATGPTGSGKTTTLYAALNRINSMEKNIITIEDPVEVHLDLIRQIQVAPKAGLTFATGLRSILRQDPDIIMVGEIRDLETADIAVQSALTGHMVFSTLHTNDAPGTVIRLVNMGVASFLIAASLNGVIAQRLVRKICPKCKESYHPSKSLLRSLEIEKKDVLFYRGKGCQYCKETGYEGRIGIFELMVISDKIRDLITADAPVTALRKEGEKEGMKSFKEDGFAKAMAGVTTIEEVARVTEARVDAGGREEVPPLEKASVPTEFVPPSFGGTININAYREKIANWLAKK